MSYFECINLGKTYKTPTGDAIIVQDFDLKIEKGEFVFLIDNNV